MKHILFLSIIICSSVCGHSQDSLFTYTKVINFDSLSRDQIFDKTMIWCGKRFNDSKSAIRVQDKASGLISGKAYYLSIYKIPKKKDSTLGLVYAETYFNWIIDIKDKKLRLRIDEVEFEYAGIRYAATYKEKPPIEIWLQSPSKSKKDWTCGRLYLSNNIEAIAASLESSINKREDNW